MNGGTGDRDPDPKVGAQLGDFVRYAVDAQGAPKCGILAGYNKYGRAIVVEDFGEHFIICEQGSLEVYAKAFYLPLKVGGRALPMPAAMRIRE